MNVAMGTAGIPMHRKKCYNDTPNGLRNGVAISPAGYGMPQRINYFKKEVCYAYLI